MSNKEERRAAFSGVLSSLLVRVIDFLKFAETKNAALLTFASAWTFASVNILISERAPIGIVGCAFRFALVLFAAAAVVAVWSFLPKLDLDGLHSDPAQSKNLLFFDHIAQFDTAAYQTRVKERFLSQATDQVLTDEYLDDLAVQISVNSKIASGKFKLFNWGAMLVLIALLVLALATASAFINRVSSGAMLWS